MIPWLLYKISRLWKRILSKYSIRYYREHLQYLGSNATITDRCEFVHPENILIGDNSYINGGMIVAGENSKIKIGKNCLISYNVHIRTTSHNHTLSDIPILLQGDEESDIVIKDNVWIGYGVQIMPGVIIGENSIVGAGAIVTRSLPPNGVYGGIPAKLIHTR